MDITEVLLRDIVNKATLKTSTAQHKSVRLGYSLPGQPLYYQVPVELITKAKEALQ
jgi:hypothetical protein